MHYERTIINNMLIDILDSSPGHHPRLIMILADLWYRAAPVVKTGAGEAGVSKPVLHALRVNGVLEVIGGHGNSGPTRANPMRNSLSPILVPQSNRIMHAVH